MVVKKRLISIISFLVLITSLMAFFEKSSAKGSILKSDKKIRIGISQIAEHPALDMARDGFLQALKSKGLIEGQNLSIEYQNAQGDIATAHLIGESFLSQHKDLIFAIGTPSAQTAYNITKDIPIVVTAVTDALEAGIVKSREKSLTNVAGTSDAVPLEKQLKLARAILPKAKTLGILYNTGEINSEIQIAALKKMAPKYDFKIITSGVSSVNDIPQVLDSIINKIDGMYILTDNLIASSLPIINSKCIHNKIPVIGAEKSHVTGGALITEGVDYYKLGYNAGLKAYDILNGTDIKNMSVEKSQDTELIINMDTADKIGFHIPKEMIDSAEIIKGDR